MKTDKKEKIIDHEENIEECYDFKDNNLGYNYIFKHKALLEKRLLQGGLRLAGALNRIFNQ